MAALILLLLFQVGFAEHEDSDVDEEADSARQKSAASARRTGLKVTLHLFFV